MPVDIPCWWYLSGQCRHMDDGYSDRCRFMHEPYHVMLALTAPLTHYSDDELPQCIPSCKQYRLQWNEGFGCSSHFHWWMFRTPVECPCQAAMGGVRLSEEDGMSDDDDVIVIKQEEYESNVQQHQQHRQLQRDQQPQSDAQAVDNKVIRQSEEDGKEDEEEALDSDDEESASEADEEWTAILPVPLHYLCLRALTTPAFELFLRTAMGQTDRDSGVHVIMHQQPCDARTPLKWGHVILYGTKEEVDRGKRALCAVMDSGYQHKADGRLLVAVTQALNNEAAGGAQAGWQPVSDSMYEQSDDDDDCLADGPPFRRAADDDELDYDDGDDEEWTTEDEAEFGVPNPPDVYDDEY